MSKPEQERTHRQSCPAWDAWDVPGACNCDRPVASPSETVPEPTFSELMDALCISYLGQGKHGFPGVRRLAVESYVAALESSLRAAAEREKVRYDGETNDRALLDRTYLLRHRSGEPLELTGRQLLVTMSGDPAPSTPSKKTNE
jgi:hypothetical protein